MKKLFIVFLLLFAFFPKHQVFAEKIDSFDVKVISQKDGKMTVVETINYNFEYGNRHGIYRYIPLYSKVGDLYRVVKIDNVNIERDGKKENFETSKNKEQIYFKIGNANKTITGPHIYKISYTVENGIGSNFPDHDEIYWNATGDDWQVQIDKASISFSNDFGAKLTDLICFEGAFGAKDKSCVVEKSTVSSGQILYSGYGLTAVAVYPRGTFPPSTLVKELPKNFGEKLSTFFLDNYHFVWFFINIILSLVLIIWYEKHKNKKRFGKPSVNFDIPKDEKGNRISPALAGAIDSAELQKDDVVAIIFDLAIRKYIKLEEEKIPKTLGILGSGKKQKIIKLKEAEEGFSSFEKTLFNKLFENRDSVYADDLKLDFYKTFQSMERQIFATLVEKKYYFKNPKAQRGFLFILGIICFGTLNIVLGIVLIFLARKLIGRTALGDEMDFKIDGLKLFLKSMDRNYKWQAEKFYTVEQMIPYAVALGYIDEFLKQIKIIKPDYNPTWYVGYHGNFYGSYGAFYSSFNSNITTSAPSSSSGSGGGGFSGGGGGGGGGGSW